MGYLVDYSWINLELRIIIICLFLIIFNKRKNKDIKFLVSGFKFLFTGVPIQITTNLLFFILFRLLLKDKTFFKHFFKSFFAPISKKGGIPDFILSKFFLSKSTKLILCFFDAKAKPSGNPTCPAPPIILIDF